MLRQFLLKFSTLRNHPTILRSCGEVSLKDVGSRITVRGWLQNVRNMGGLLFATVRDTTGVSQIVLYHECDIKELQNVREESPIEALGEVRKRPDDMINHSMNTGSIEIVADSINILNSIKFDELNGRLPVEIENSLSFPQVIDLSKENNLKHRYLKLRGSHLQQIIKSRSYIIQKIREYLINEADFVEVETPLLFKSTPEGANEFLVPYNEKLNYALPQSPQQFKQLLMVGGISKYFQIAKCFRNESNRADRQPEFTQLDLEMSFTTQEEIMKVIEQTMKVIFSSGLQQAIKAARVFSVPATDSKETFRNWYEQSIPPILQNTLGVPFKRLTYEYVMTNYGSDKPDLRVPLRITKIITLETNENETIQALKLDKNTISFSNKDIEKLLKELESNIGDSVSVCIFKAKKSKMHLLETKTASFDQFKCKDRTQLFESIATSLDASEGDLILLAKGENYEPHKGLHYIIRKYSEFFLPVEKKNMVEMYWVVEFPLFELTRDGSLQSVHHPFTRVAESEVEDFMSLSTDPLMFKSQAFDLVCNGVEIGGGSIRIFQSRELRRVFTDYLGYSDEYVDTTFSHYFKAFNFGAPPHGGMAIGMDRLLSIIFGTKNISSVIAFPKNSRGEDLLTGTPS